MIIKRENSKILVCAVLLILIALSTVVSRENLRVESHDIYENYMSLEPGFSSARNISDTGGYITQQSIFSKLGLIVSRSPQSIWTRLAGSEKGKLKKIKIIFCIFSFHLSSLYKHLKYLKNFQNKVLLLL